MLRRMKGKRREHLSVRTVRHIAGLLSVALNKAFRAGTIQVNLMLRVELPTARPPTLDLSRPIKSWSSERPVERMDFHVDRDYVGNWRTPRRTLGIAVVRSRFGDRTLTISKSLEQTGDLIFAQPNGDHLEPDLVSQVIIRRMRRAGIPGASLHTLRHSLTCRYRGVII